MPLGYRLGLPAWAFSGWQDTYFPRGQAALASYASVFNAVEGNTTFYRVPTAARVDSWREALAGRDFEICFKLPRTVTHERTPQLDDLRAFLRAVERLETHLGPLLLQFPATVDAAAINAMTALFEALPAGWRYVVEVRHAEFFAAPERLTPLLDRLGAGRVSLDARALYEGNTLHPEVVRALHEKPDVPVLDAVWHGLAFTRLVLHPDGRNEAYLQRWAHRVAAQRQAGIDSYVMIHCPNNQHCPAFARHFHEALAAQYPDAGTLPGWPVPQQASLL